MTSFAHWKLHPATQAALAGLGIDTPTPIQSEAIPALLAGRDIVGQARTGSGKTLAFAIPIVERCAATEPGVQALVLVPTRELASQVAGVIGRLTAAHGLRLILLYGGRSLVPERQALRSEGQIVVGTPGRTLDHLRQGNLSLRRLRMFVLDEGDEMLDKGFAPVVEQILAQAPAQRQTALLSATIPQWVMTTAARHLRNPTLIRVDRATQPPPEIEHIVYELEPDAKLAALRTLLDRRGEGQLLVFGRTKHGVKKLARQLSGQGYPVAALQGNLSQSARNRIMADFRSGDTPILLATNVAARGLDVAGIAQVINYELPESAELFTHRAGRTGRSGRSGEVVSFITPEDGPKLKGFERALGRRFLRGAWRKGEAAPTPARRPA